MALAWHWGPEAPVLLNRRKWTKVVFRDVGSFGEHGLDVTLSSISKSFWLVDWLCEIFFRPG